MTNFPGIRDQKNVLNKMGLGDPLKNLSVFGQGLMSEMAKFSHEITITIDFTP